MIEGKTIDRILLHLAEQISVLDRAGGPVPDQIHLMEQWNERAVSVLDTMHKELERCRQQLEDRMAMQRACRDVAWNESTFAVYRAEQVAFCQRWIRLCRQMWMAEDQRCKIHLTAAQIVLLVRLARETEILPDVALKQSFAFLSAHITTQKQQRLSYESLRKKYSEIDPKNLQAIRAVLQRLIRAADAHIDRG